MEQPNNTKVIQTPQGPVFEPGPGWHGHIRNWAQRHPYAATLIFFFIIVILVFIVTRPVDQGIQVIKIENEATQAPPQLQALHVIEQIVEPQDNHTLVVRRAISQYVASHSDGDISKGQRLYAETTMTNTIQNNPLHVGSVLSFSRDEIQSHLIDAFTQLTPYQQDTWERNARFVAF